ncbi:hypothetical protein ACFWAR_26525 [Streptomyces sp. NPDC059917]|uniref:hypothetical protein n=1 Tax=Streptomyces sp. NPDC059917 TaxID=3347002 RepID=UPI00365F48BD
MAGVHADPDRAAHRGYLSDFYRQHDTGTPSRTPINPCAFAEDPDALFFVGLALADA